MARNISAASLTKLATNLGTEPINIVEIQWVPNGPRDTYADRDIAASNIKGKILEVGPIDDVVQVSGGGQSQQFSVVLDDTDGSLKQILDTTDIHKRSCWIYQWFEGLATSEKFLIFKGEINSPVEWNEGDRTVSFDVISKIEDVEVGFSIEEGNFVSPPEDLIGKPWPLCFGTVINVPALQIQSVRQGILATGVGIMDFTLEHRLRLAKKLICALNFLGFRGSGTPGLGSSSLMIVPIYEPDPNCVKSACEAVETLELQLAEQSAYEYGTIRVFGGSKFPQGKLLTLDINGGKFNGTFNGEVFTITSRLHPDMDTSTGLPVVEEPENTIRSNCGDKFGKNQNNGNDPDAAVPDQFGNDPVQLAEESRKSWAAYNDYPTSSFFWANAGAKVTMASDEEIIYVANILPSTILRVAAYRDLEGGRQLLTVPSEYYTIRQTNYGTYEVMEIVFTRPLSSRGLGWSDDIYVTLTSSVGPNTVDILQWFIDTYTDYGTDATTFNAIRTKIDNYPMNFPLLDRRNLINVLEEIAFQARCAIYLKDDTFFLKYLAEEPAADDTVGESDILAKSLTVFHTPTEDLVTKYVAEWRKDYAIEKPNKLILRHNVAKYGTHEKPYSFYCYNILDLVRKSATFWLIRKSNTWRKARFKTPVSKLKLESFDTIGLTLPDIASGTIKAFVEVANYNSDDHTIDFEIWTPVKSGTNTMYSFAWPALVSETLIFPTIDERNQGFAGSGDGPNFSVIAPNGHILSNRRDGLFQGFQLACNGEATDIGQTGCRGDFGDAAPSDIGDDKPTVDADEDQNGAINTGTSPITSGTKTANSDNCCELAKQALEEAKRARQDAARGNASNEKEREGDLEELPENECEAGNCEALVTLKWIQVSLVAKATGGTSSTIGDTGKILLGDIESATQCLTFNSAKAAKAFRDQKVAETTAISDSFAAEVGKQYVWVTSTASADLGLDQDEESATFGQPCPEPAEADVQITGYSGDAPTNPGI